MPLCNKLNKYWNLMSSLRPYRNIRKTTRPLYATAIFSSISNAGLSRFLLCATVCHGIVKP